MEGVDNSVEMEDGVDQKVEMEESDIEREHEAVSLPDSDSYDLLSDESEDEQEVARPEAREAAEEQVVNVPRPEVNEAAHFIPFLGPEYWRDLNVFNMMVEREYNGQGEGVVPDPQYLVITQPYREAAENYNGQSDGDEIINGRTWNEYYSYDLDHRRRNLWPIAARVIYGMKMSGKYRLCTPINDQPMYIREYEKAVAYLMQEEYPVHLDINKANEFEEFRIYKNKRTEKLSLIADDFHAKRGTRPGQTHPFGFLFPLQFSYDLIEYLCCVLNFKGVNLSMMINTGQAHPEFYELDEKYSQFIEFASPLNVECFEEVNNQMDMEAKYENQDEEAFRYVYGETLDFYNRTFENFVIQSVAQLRAEGSFFI